MPNYSANSSHAWLPTQATTNMMESFYQKEWPTYLACKHMHKSCRRIFFPDYCGYNTGEFGVQCLVCCHWPKQHLRHWTNLPTWPSSLQTVVPMYWIGWKNKCLIITTQTNLPEAHAWIDTNLELMIQKSIPLGIDPPSSLLLHQLNRPVYLATSHTYANI